MASYYRRKNGTYCIRVSNGKPGGKQVLDISHPRDYQQVQQRKERKSLPICLKRRYIMDCILPAEKKRSKRLTPSE